MVSLSILSSIKFYLNLNLHLSDSSDLLDLPEPLDLSNLSESSDSSNSLEEVFISFLHTYILPIMLPDNNSHLFYKQNQLIKLGNI